MTKVNFEENFEIYLFTATGPENNFSKLSEFLSFLKFNKVCFPYRFSYVGRSDGLIPELTLNENILMDFNPDSLTTKREFQFQEFLKEQPNHSLLKLYQKIDVPDSLPIHTDAQMKKISSLIKSLIFEGQFIFLEGPEKDLDEESMALFISSLKDHITRYKMNVFIFSYEVNLWKAHVQKYVKREPDYSFSIEKVAQGPAWNKERTQFYTLIDNEDSLHNSLEDNLIFQIPKKIERKSAA